MYELSPEQRMEVAGGGTCTCMSFTGTNAPLDSTAHLSEDDCFRVCCPNGFASSGAWLFDHGGGRFISRPCRGVTKPASSQKAIESMGSFFSNHLWCDGITGLL